ncbi:MAG: glycoside hydrolase family 1 protein [Candidatus Omnitrophota bacterium]|nr:glycoside hydrolase family 1 protein [Candidatus Omnitrophota bacterium]
MYNVLIPKSTDSWYNPLMIKFPRNFLWGAATSAYQVEGNNVNSDWWQWEKEAGKKKSGAACRHYEFYERDFNLAKDLHHNAHRLSIEWSRIEPKEGKFSRKELKHYIKVILALRRRNIEPIVTLHHFTNPVWFSKKGGWVNPRSVPRFLRYCNFVVSALAKQVRYWITINEPTVYISHSYIFGIWPPQSKSYLKATAAGENMAWAHIRAHRLIHRIYKRLKIGEPPAVSIAQNVMAFVPARRDLKSRVSVYLRDRLYNLGFLERIMRHNLLNRPMDFIGVNYYSRHLVEQKRRGRRSRYEKNSLGWDIYPQGLYEVLIGLKKYNLPVMITENGICTPDDSLRWRFIRSHLKNIHRAIREGVYVIGYLYWSLLDNFEWDKGFSPRFGLIGIDYKTYKRTVRKSAKMFARACKTGILE